MTRVKICGITSDDDARAAAAAGVDALGFVFAPSPRQVSVEQAAAIGRGLARPLLRVGVFVDPTSEALDQAVERAALDVVQLHGGESPDFCHAVARPVWKRIAVHADDTPQRIAARAREFEVAALLIDPGRGDGRPFPWTLVRDIEGRLVLAGGLTPENVREAVRVARPWAVDVSSGVEVRPGVKDAGRMRAFVRAVRPEEGIDAS